MKTTTMPLKVLQAQTMQTCTIQLVATPTGYQVIRVAPFATMFLTDTERWTKYTGQAFTWAEYLGAFAAWSYQILNNNSNGWPIWS